VDSTNNYALNLLRDQNLTERQMQKMHGTAVFAHEQFQGKGQRGKTWLSAAGENIQLSVIIAPQPLQLYSQFFLTMIVALAVRAFLEEKSGKTFSIKWANDIYFQDKKAGGILIENIIYGNGWKWAVAGIGLNINQIDFDPSLPNPVSLKQISGNNFDCVTLAKELSKKIISFFENFVQSTSAEKETDLLKTYNAHLYKRGEKVRLKKNNRIFETTIKEVTANGLLITEHGMEESFSFGEVEWVWKKN
jgi:BirA family biotin operon repressor/biotin-[acetyl-CoA-carboxylase] ligase